MARRAKIAPKGARARSADLKAAEDAAASRLRTALEAFIEDPTGHQQRCLTNQLEVYQTAWMHGRTRPFTPRS